jgi:SsrA-binding protein
MSKEHKRVVARNKRARFEYEFIEELEAGLSLTGSEVKSLREGRASIAEAYIRFSKGEAWLVGATIQPYAQASYNNHATDRQRKLLLHRKEINRLDRGTREKGLTAVPLELYFKGARVKLALALARGRKQHDKREYLKKRDAQRDMDRSR